MPVIGEEMQATLVMKIPFRIGFDESARSLAITHDRA
jgi:hypothetical protein